MENILYQLQSSSSGVSEIINQFSGVMAAVVFIIGIIQCYFGFKLFKVWLAIGGFIVGAIVGVFIGGVAFNSGGAAIIFGFILAVILAYLAVKIYFLGIFILGGSCGFIIAMILSNSTPLSVVFGIIIGIIAAYFTKIAIIASTSISGGLSAGVALKQLLNGQESLSVIFVALFVITGLYVQYKMNKDSSKPKMATSNHQDENNQIVNLSDQGKKKINEVISNIKEIGKTENSTKTEFTNIINHRLIENSNYKEKVEELNKISKLFKSEIFTELEYKEKKAQWIESLKLNSYKNIETDFLNEIIPLISDKVLDADELKNIKYIVSGLYEKEQIQKQEENRQITLEENRKKRMDMLIEIKSRIAKILRKIDSEKKVILLKIETKRQESKTQMANNREQKRISKNSQICDCGQLKDINFKFCENCGKETNI